MALHVLLLCPATIGSRMSGMGIRYVEIGAALAARGHDVVVAARSVEGSPVAGLRLAEWSPDRLGSLRELLGAADAVLSPPAAPHVTRMLRRAGARLVIDLYDPESFEVLERFRSERLPLRALHATTATDRLVDALRSGDFFVCASERQRDLWLGAMLALGVIGPRAYDRDPTLRDAIDLVPFGVPAAPPADAGSDPIRARFPDIGADERILLWNGGLWRWLDAPIAVRALGRLHAEGVDARLVFMGVGQAGGAADALVEVRSAIAAERLPDGAVLFNDKWVDYGERGAWLRHADVAVSTHREHVETRFAFRTRLLDCFWAGLPAVVSAGDTLADEIVVHDLGAAAAPGDLDGLVAGLGQVLDRGRDSYVARLREAAERHSWSRAVASLAAFLERPADPRPFGRRNPLAIPPTVLARRVGQRFTRAVRAVRW